MKTMAAVRFSKTQLFFSYCREITGGQGRSTCVYNNQLNIFRTWAGGQELIRRPPYVPRSGWQQYSRQHWNGISRASTK